MLGIRKSYIITKTVGSFVYLWYDCGTKYGGNCHGKKEKDSCNTKKNYE